MPKHDINDTIAAISTPPGESGIGIVRISGKKALAVTERVFIAKDGSKPADFKSYTIHYGWIVRNNKVIDEVILNVMRSPRSYTKEDIVEINCHGGIVALRAVLDLVLENGCRLAEPGEFTKRAFLNGRIDLAQAEAVLEIIRAKTDSALKIGIEQLKGGLSLKINTLRKELSDLLPEIEANIDFPEEEIETLDLKILARKLKNVNDELASILKSSRHARVMREGVHAVICGKPNVGKSSLLNALLKQERSIVTPVAGTTRDTVEEIIDIRGIPVRIVDTAGILEPRDLIERKAVERSRRSIELADLVLLLFDGNQELSGEDKLLMRRLHRKVTIAVINKMDLQQKIEREKVLKKFKNTVDISAKKFKNINFLEDMIADLVYGGKVSLGEMMLTSNLRHIQAIRQAQKFVAGALDSLDNKVSLEFIAQDIRDALGYLDDLVGKKFSGDLLDKIFSHFCIGK
jgi:tRNA modification GTPase